MYSTCIFCSNSLGGNDIIEHFPVGSRVAFDAARGRLWAVCARCQRWNLAPIEERWEAVEDAERQFRDARLRVQSENIGLAKMRDGTHLIRIGAAFRGEVAAWRYGSQMVKRRRTMLITLGVGSIGMTAYYGLPYLLGGVAPLVAVYGGLAANAITTRRSLGKVILRVTPQDSPTGVEMLIRNRNLLNSRIALVNQETVFFVRDPAAYRRIDYVGMRGSYAGPPLEITGRSAHALVQRAMARLNSSGATTKRVNAAVSVLETIGSAEKVVELVTAENPTLLGMSTSSGDDRAIISPQHLTSLSQGKWPSRPPVGTPRRLDPVTALAFEMALHDESERRAMEGELDDLEEAWREAESIARIADALPDEPPE